MGAWLLEMGTMDISNRADKHPRRRNFGQVVFLCPVKKAGREKIDNLLYLRIGTDRIGTATAEGQVSRKIKNSNRILLI